MLVDGIAIGVGAESPTFDPATALSGSTHLVGTEAAVAVGHAHEVPKLPPPNRLDSPGSGG